MVMRQLGHQTIVVDASAQAVAVETSLVLPADYLEWDLTFVTPAKSVTMEHNVKNAPTVTMETHSSQAVAVSRVRVTTILIRQITETVTYLQEDVLLVCTILQASVVSAVNQVTMVTLLLGIAQNAFVTVMGQIPVLLTRVIT